MHRSNFLQTPNIAFDLLTNEYDLVGYQKLLRAVGVGNTWKGGNNALQKLLGMSYGRVIKLKNKLVEVEFIEIVKGDNGHGEADAWKILDVFEYKTTLSPDVQGLSRNGQGTDTLSPNEQGQEPANTGVSENQSQEAPCHDMNKPLSPDEQATLSPNEQHKENIYSEEIFKIEENTHTNALARAYPLKHLYEAFPNLEITPAQADSVISEVKPDDLAAWLSTIKIYQDNFNPAKNRYMPDKIGNVLSVFKSEKIKFEKQNGAKPNGNRNRNGNGNGLSKREQSAVDSHQVRERINARVQSRRSGSVPGRDVPDR